MKRFLIGIFLFTSTLLSAQSFEGTLTYKMDFEVSEKIAKMGMNKEMLLKKMKEEGSWSDTLKMYYKGGNYYGLISNNPKSWSFYNAATNKIYAMVENSDICTVTDASMDTEQEMTGALPIITKLDTTVVVNGINCSIVRIKWKSGTTDNYYNSSKLIADPALYANHKFEGWEDYLKISHALPLKIVRGLAGMMVVTITLVSEKAEPISDKLFVVPVLVADKALNPVKLPNREIMRIKK